MADWDRRFMDLADTVANWSKDRSTRVGAVIVDPVSRAVVSMGYNGFPRGINDDVPERHERPLKYKITEHAERNSLYNAGCSVRGMTIYTQFFPCTDCARGIIQTGITRVVTVKPDFNHERWGEDFKISSELLLEAGVILDFV